jgi:muramoyltetrapeptide carboxypeptidase
MSLEAQVEGLEVFARLGAEVQPLRAPDAARDHPFWLADTDDARADELVAALAARPRGVWMGRGGFGSVRTLQRAESRIVTQQALCQVPLWGFSDGTVLTSFWADHGWPSWSAPPISQLPRLDRPSLLRLEAALAGRVPPFEGLAPANHGEAAGPLAGGNLTVLGSLVGTPYMPSLAGKILVIEDVHEVAYRVDRLFVQLRLAGCLDGVLAIVGGDFTGVSPVEVDGIRSIMTGLAKDLGIPCATGLPIGHGTQNACLPIGANAVLEVGAEARLEVLR